MTDIGNGTMEDLPIGAIGLAQQVPRIGFATTGDARGIDIYSIYYNNILNQEIPLSLLRGYLVKGRA
jgi:hypothetical protein